MIEKINPYHYEHAGPVVIDYIRKLESIADEYNELLSGGAASSTDDNFPTFKINSELWDLKKFDFLNQRYFPKIAVYSMEAFMRTAKLFMQHDHPYDFNATMIMVYAYPLDVFHHADVSKIFNKYKVGPATCMRMLTKLVDAGYLGVIKKNNYESKKKHTYYITPAGQQAVRKFLKEVNSIEFNLDVYEENIRWAVRETQGSGRKRVGYVSRHETIFGQPIPSRFKGKKSRNRDSDNTRPT